MKTRLVLFLWYLFFICQFFIPWCETVGNLTHVINFTNVENETSIDLAYDDDIKCIVNLTSVNNVTCTYYNETSELYGFGSDLLDTLPKEFSVAFKAHEDVNLTQEKEYLLEIIEQNNLAEIYYDINEDDTNSTSVYEVSEEDKIIEMIAQFSKYIEKSGKRGLKTLAYKVKNLVNPTLYLNHILKVPKYLSELEKYFSFILEKKIQCVIDQQFIILDMLESSVKIFGRASEEMCGVIVQEGNITLSLYQIDAIEEAIGLAVFNEKKESFNYICKKTYVCKHFPAYSDYVAKLLKTILKLEEKYFMIIVNIIEDTVYAKSKFLESILDDKLAQNFTLGLISISDNPLEVSSLMTIVIKNIMQRYKVFYINGVDIRNSTKAIRILIDMIDVTFQIPEENILGSDFRDLIKNITEWGRGKKRNMGRILSDFLYDSVDFLDICWNHEIKEQVKVLIQFLIKGTSDNETLCDSLLTNSSSIVTGEYTIYAENEELNLI